MGTPDPLAEFYAASPRHSAALGGRSGVHAQVDSALNELQVPATLDQDGDWKLQTDVGPFLLVLDKQSSDLVAIQTIQSMERKVKNSADEMHVLMALNFEARGIARFGIVKDNDQNLLVLTARLAPEEVSTDGVQRMLRDCFRLSRRVDELLGNAPAQPPAQPGGWQAADAALAQAEAGGGAAAPQQAAAPAPGQAPAEAPAEETVFEQPVPQAPPANAAPGEPASASPGGGAEPTYPPPAAEPEPVQSYPPPAQPEPVHPPPTAPDPAPAYPAPAQPEPVYQPPAEPVQPAAPVSPPPQALPPANWYEDPYQQARLRYWDGQRWTEHVAQ